MGLSLSDVYTSIQLMLAPVYANDFFYGGRVLRVNMQADAPFRGIDRRPDPLLPAELDAGHDDDDQRQRARPPAMIPLSNVVQTKWSIGSPALTRYNGFEAIEIVGAEAPGSSSGEAMDAIAGIVKNDLPAGYGFDWTGQSPAGNHLRQPGADAVRAVDPGRVPVPGRAVRELVDSVRGAAGRAARHHRRPARDLGPRPDQRRLLQDRHPDHHRPGREERDPDRRILRRGTARRGASSARR